MAGDADYVGSPDRAEGRQILGLPQDSKSQPGVHPRDTRDKLMSLAHASYEKAARRSGLGALALAEQQHQTSKVAKSSRTELQRSASTA